MRGFNRGVLLNVYKNLTCEKCDKKSAKIRQESISFIMQIEKSHGMRYNYPG